jgi:hypothetical protein
MILILVLMPEPVPSEMQPQRFVQIVETILGEERPLWSRKALAKFLTLIFPEFPSKKWEACLTKPAGATGLVDMLKEDEAWVLGRVHRAMCEARAEHFWEKPPLTALSWLETGDFETGAPLGGTGFQAVIAKHCEETIRQPVNSQIKFWKSFGEAYSLPIRNRQHDAKTVLAYITLVCGGEMFNSAIQSARGDWGRKRAPLSKIAQEKASDRNALQGAVAGAAFGWFSDLWGYSGAELQALLPA